MFRNPTAAHPPQQRKPPAASALCCVAHDGIPQIHATMFDFLRSHYHSVSVECRGISTYICFDSLSPTQALTALAEARETQERDEAEEHNTTMRKHLNISSMKLCKLHQLGKCKLGTSCRNIHLCRTVTLREAPPAATGSATILPPILATNTNSTSHQHMRPSDSPVEDFCLPPLGALGPATPTPPAAPSSSRGTSANSLLTRFARRWRLDSSPAVDSAGGSVSSRSCTPITRSSTERIGQLLRCLKSRSATAAAAGSTTSNDGDVDDVLIDAGGDNSSSPQPKPPAAGAHHCSFGRRSGFYHSPCSPCIPAQ